MAAKARQEATPPPENEAVAYDDSAGSETLALKVANGEDTSESQTVPVNPFVEFQSQLRNLCNSYVPSIGAVGIAQCLQSIFLDTILYHVDNVSQQSVQRAVQMSLTKTGKTHRVKKQRT